MIEITTISKGEQWCSSTVKGKEKEKEEINGGHDKNNGGDGGCCEEDGTRSPEEGGGQAETKVLDEAEVQAEKAIDGVSSTATTAATTAQSVKAADVIVAMIVVATMQAELPVTTHQTPKGSCAIGGSKTGEVG